MLRIDLRPTNPPGAGRTPAEAGSPRELGYAFGAACAEAALAGRYRPAVMSASDIDDMVELCGDRVQIVAVWFRRSGVVPGHSGRYRAGSKARRPARRYRGRASTR